MAYRTTPPDPSKPVYHGSAFPWSAVETAGAIHVGESYEQAADLLPKKPNAGYEPNAVILQKGGIGSGTYQSGEVRRAFKTQHPNSIPNGGMSELMFNPGVGFHDVDLSDKAANTAHLAHSREADYPRGGSISESSFDFKPATIVSETTNDFKSSTDLYGATQALRENKVLRYANTLEGDGKGLSYVVPNPDLNLRQFTEEPKPVAGKEYHQTPLPGIDLAAYRNEGPFDEPFNDGGPEWVSMGDSRQPNMSRTRRRTPVGNELPAPKPAPEHERLF